MMNVTVRMISIGLMLFFLMAGCSKEEQSPPPGDKPKVVKPIVKPAPKRAEAPPVPEKELASVETAQTSPALDKPSEARPETAPEEKISPPTEKKAGHEKGAGEKKSADTEKKPAPKDEAGVHFVKKGETLWQIAQMDSVYGDAHKWVMLYRFNLDKLGTLPAGDEFPTQALPEGLRLKIMTPEEVGENLKKRPENFWVVNILSSTENKKIVSAAVKLIQNGYPVYITTARVKEKDWMRLRLGFFKTKKEADEKGEKIKAMLNAVDSWSTKTGEKEIENFGGF
ncbi:MAG: SPOR domain-containing protein [Pseudomonadota bacterium]